MSKAMGFVIGGALIGLFLGSSTGVAMMGTAYNGAIIFGPLGAFIGWLVSKRNEKKAGEPPLKPSPSTGNENQSENKSNVASNIGADTANVFISVLTILATVWNFHIDLLEMIKILPVFQDKPWLFFVLAVVVSAFFPPFIAVYFICYLGAAHFGVKPENGYRSSIGGSGSS